MDFTAAVLLIVFLLLVVLPYFFRRTVKDEATETFAVGRRDYGWFGLTAGLSATFVGGAAMLNLPSVGYTFGWWALADVIPTTLALLMCGVVLVPVLRARPDALSVGTYLQRSGRLISVVAGLLSFVVYTLIAAAQLLAVATLLGTYLPVPTPWLTAGVGIAVGSYIAFNGYRAVTLTDKTQFVLMLLGFVCVMAIVVTIAPGFEGAVEPFEATRMPLNMVLLLGIPLLFVPASQDVHVRIHSAVSRRHAMIGCLCAAAAYLIFGTLATAIGVTAAESGLPVDNPDRVAPIYFNAVLGDFAVIPLIAVLAAIVSTLDSVLFAAVTSLAFDVGNTARTAEARRGRIAVTLATGVILCLAVFVALAAPRILSVILSALIIYVAVLLPLLLGVALRVRKSLLAAIAILVLVFTSLNEAFGWQFPYRAFAICGMHGAVVLILSLVAREDHDATHTP